MELYEYYIEMIDKKPTSKIRDIKKHDSPLESDCGGKLKSDLIMIDIDSEDEANVLYKIVLDKDIQCDVVQTTRGKHFYFLNSNVKTRKIKTLNAIGLEMDILPGTRNVFDPIVVNGKTREHIRQCETLDVLPQWLTPINGVHFRAMSEGSRNQELFNYILKLQSSNYRNDEIKVIVAMINKYVLHSPLPKRELDVILRDGSFAKPTFFIENKFQHHTFSRYLMRKHSLCRISGVLHTYKDGLYVDDPKLIERFMIDEIDSIKNNHRVEAFRYLSVMTETETVSSERYILLKNGIYDVKTKQLMPHSTDYKFKNLISTNYNPDAYSEVVDSTLDNIACGDKDIRTLILEMIGYCLYRRNELGKAFIFVGSGSNGKSTLITMIRSLLGDENVSSLDIKDLSKEFKLSMLYGKLANLGDDISSGFIDDSSEFKKLITGETMSAQRKFQDPFDFKNYSKFIFSANKLPKTNDKSHGFYRRFCPIPLNARFDVKNKGFDLFIIDRLTSPEALEYLLKLAIENLHNVLNNRKFTEPISVLELKQSYRLQNNNVMQFYDETNLVIMDNTLKSYYLKYQSWCIETGHKHCSKSEFKSELYDMGWTPSDEPTRLSGVVGRYFKCVEEE